MDRAGEPVDVVHPGPLLTCRRAGNRGVHPMRLDTPRAGDQDRGHLISGGWLVVKDEVILRADLHDVNDDTHHVGAAHAENPRGCWSADGVNHQ